MTDVLATQAQQEPAYTSSCAIAVAVEIRYDQLEFGFVPITVQEDGIFVSPSSHSW